MPKDKKTTPKVRSASPYPLEKTNNNPIEIVGEAGPSGLSQNPVVDHSPHEPLVVNNSEEDSNSNKVKSPEIELDPLCQGVKELNLHLPHVGTQIKKYHMYAEGNDPDRELICHEIKRAHLAYRRTHRRLLLYLAHFNLDYILPPSYTKVMSGLRTAARRHRMFVRRLIRGNPNLQMCIAQ